MTSDAPLTLTSKQLRRIKNRAIIKARVDAGVTSDDQVSQVNKVEMSAIGDVYICPAAPVSIRISLSSRIVTDIHSLTTPHYFNDYIYRYTNTNSSGKEKYNNEKRCS